MSEYSADERQLLLTLAHDSIISRLAEGKALSINPRDYPTALQQSRACFVTLHKQGHLRGCIGSLQPRQALVLDVVQNACSAAFRDPRFQPVSLEEVPELTIDISVLGPASNMEFDSESDLLAQLRPGIDGLILSEGQHRATFLPTVWEQLPAAQDFVNQLKLKAGLSRDYWSNNIQIQRYVTELIK